MTGPDGLLKQVTKNVLEPALNEEMTEHLGHEKNRAEPERQGADIGNGTRSKTVLIEALGEVGIEVPRGREGSFELQSCKPLTGRGDILNEDTGSADSKTEPGRRGIGSFMRRGARGLHQETPRHVLGCKLADIEEHLSPSACRECEIWLGTVLPLRRSCLDEYSEARKFMVNHGLNESVWSNTVVIADALKRGIAVSVVRHLPRVVLRHRGRQFRWGGGRTTFNTRLARKICHYKDVQSRLLINSGISMPENAAFAQGQARRAWSWGGDSGSLVVKPLDGRQGRDVHVDITEWGEFEQAFEQVAAVRGKALVEKFHAGTEHRCLVVRGRFVAATRRRPASVVGNGTGTVADLVSVKNSTRGRIHVPLQLGDRERVYLRKHGFSPDTVPGDCERVHLLGTSNIHAGGDAIDATDDVSNDEREFIERAVLAVPGLNVVGLDVLLPRGEEDVKPTVIELNASPMISMHHFPLEGISRDAAGAVLDAMFPVTRVASE